MSIANSFSKMVREDRFGFSQEAFEHFDAEILKLENHYHFNDPSSNISSETLSRFKEAAKTLISRCQKMK